MNKIDPITFEILRHRLWQITEEMAITLKRVSGSPITTEAADYMVALFKANGDTLVAGCGVLLHVATTSQVCKCIIERYSENPGINEGDTFFFNDPYLGCMHQPDASIVSTIHYNGELIGWTGTMTHLLDIGGIDPGGMCPRARDIFQEGIRFPGIKIVEQGRLRKDVFDSITNMCREPELVGLDIKAQIAASEVAKERMHDLINRYDIETIKMVFDDMIIYSEGKLRKRLKEFPDGVWRTIEYLDHDGVTDKVYKVALEMTKKNDTLIFDFKGTSEQAPGFVNVTKAGALGGIFASIAPLLCYDIPWNQGILNPVELILPEGSLINPEFPAPVSMASIAAATTVLNATIITLSKMFSCNKQFKKELTAVWGNSVPVLVMSGINKDRKPFVTMFMDEMPGGGGARSYADGVDTAGISYIPPSSAPNVETYELMFPVLYLFRRQGIDSGGAGKFRGGVGGEYSITLYGSPIEKAIATLYGTGFEPATATPLFGGYPANNNRWVVVRGTDILERIKKGDFPEFVEQLKGKLEILPTKGVTEFANGDVFYCHWMGGGGYGDPIDRDPNSICKDVTNELVSLRCSKEIYGVIINPETLEINIEKTKEMRREIRRNRLQREIDWKESFQKEQILKPLGEYIKIDKISGKEMILCQRCEYIFCPLTENYKNYAIVSENPLMKGGPKLSSTKRFILREFYCPECGTMLEVEMILKDLPFIWDIQIIS